MLDIVVVCLVVTAALAAIRWRLSSDAIATLVEKTARIETLDGARLGSVVKVVGRIEPRGAPLKAPLTGRACVFYEVTVEASAGDPTIRECRATTFAVATSMYRAEFDAERMKVHSAIETVFTSGFMNDATPAQEALLARHGGSSRRSGILYTNRTLTYTERRLDPGDTVAVIGRVGRHEPGPIVDLDGSDPAYREAPRAIHGPGTLFIEPLSEGIVIASRQAA